MGISFFLSLIKVAKHSVFHLLVTVLAESVFKDDFDQIDEISFNSRILTVFCYKWYWILSNAFSATIVMNM